MRGLYGPMGGDVDMSVYMRVKTDDAKLQAAARCSEAADRMEALRKSLGELMVKIDVKIGIEELIGLPPSVFEAASGAERRELAGLMAEYRFCRSVADQASMLKHAAGNELEFNMGAMLALFRPLEASWQRHYEQYGMGCIDDMVGVAPRSIGLGDAIRRHRP